VDVEMQKSEIPVPAMAIAKAKNQYANAR